MMISDCRLGFIGFGHMAQVLCRAFDRAKLIPRSQISFIRRDRDKSRKNEQEFGITATSLEHLIAESDLLILAVRPSQIEPILKELVRLKIDPSKWIVSVLAGVKLAYYQKFLKNPLLRVMPNIASAVAEGMSVFTYGPHAPDDFRTIAHRLFSSTGEVVEVSEEATDLCCGISGSGPAFVFRLIEAVARHGEKHGIEYAKSLKLAAQTFAGAARLILKGGQPDALLQQITTPNGTTEAGLKVMSQLQIDTLYPKVIDASAKRSKELSEEFN
jgi:pyrroline-5-carboxylate reductase